MRLLIQRVAEAWVMVDTVKKASISKGLLVFVGVEDGDSQEDIDWLSKKLVNLRIFSDQNDVMNLSVLQVDGEILVVSQFTLHASTKKGNRPSYSKASRPDVAIPLYESFLIKLTKDLGKNLQTGVFGADMKVGLVNDGPITIFIDSKQKQ